MRKRIGALLMAVVMACSLAGCAATDQSANTVTADTSEAEESGNYSAGGEVSTDGDTIKIGLVSMVTGDNPLNGERMNQGVQLAVDEVNAAGGILGKQVELTITDDQTMQDVAVTCVQKLASEGVVGIVGPHRSTNAIAVSDTVKSLGVPLLTGGTSPNIADLDNPYLFRGRASDTIFAQAAVDYAVNTLGCSKIGLFYNNDDFGTGALGVIQQYCDENGITLVAEGHNTGDKDFTAQIMKMQTAGIDCAIIWTHDPELAIHARQIYELGLECQVVSSPGVTMSQVLGMVEPEYVEGWYGVTDFVSTSTDEEVVNFIEKFKAAYDIEPELYAASYYGCAKVLLTAIENAGTTDRDAVRDEIEKIQDLQVPIGVAACDESHDLIHSINVARIENLTPIFVESVSVE